MNKKKIPNLNVNVSNNNSSSCAVAQAMIHIKSFMTDNQKSNILLREARIHMDQGDLRAAIECFSEGINYNPTLNLFNLRATCYKLLEMYKESYFDYSYVIRMEPENGAHYCSRGLCLAKMKKLAMSIEDLDTAISFDPNPLHYYSRATTYAEFEKYDLAIQAIGPIDVNSSYTLSEIKLRCKYRRALCYFQLGKYSEVVKDCVGIISQDPNSVQARALHGRALKILNNYKKAEEELSIAILLDTQNFALYIERGDIRFRTGQQIKVIEAVYDFDKSIMILKGKLEHKRNGSVSNIILPYDMMGSSINIATITTSAAGGITNGGQSIHRSKSIFVSSPPKGSNHNHISKSSKNNNNDYNDNSDIDDLFNGEWGDNRPDSPNNNLLGLTDSTSIISGGGGMKRDVVAPPLKSHLPPGAVIPSTYFQELEEKLADAYYKRSQAKLMTDPSSHNIESALQDAQHALALSPLQNDYHMVATTCYIRLNQYSEALKVLRHILERDPEHAQALYHYAFCQRASGSQRDAIEGLTKIIVTSVSTEENNSNNNILADYSSRNVTESLPIHRVFEMRGTLFHEIQAHKLALMDLGKAIALNPSSAENYFLRGDCHSKLGNYEQALADFNLAESYLFEDKCSIYIARGGVKRLLRRSKEAATDYNEAYNLLDKHDKVGKVRILSFQAFCLIDDKLYDTAYETLIVALQLNRDIMIEKMSKINSQMDKLQMDAMITSYLQSYYDDNDSLHLKHPLPQLENDMLYLKRIEWILLYHKALCVYMQKQFIQAEQILLECVSDNNRKFVPDNISLGLQLFFLGQSLIRNKRYKVACKYLEECSMTHWIDNRYNEFLLRFALAKVYQCLNAHQKALEMFNIAINLSNQQSPHCYFRRAWAYKALGNYVAAGDDFETAKSKNPDDPNFAVNYKKISHCAYMEIEDDPDIIEPFVSLLSVPGLGI